MSDELVRLLAGTYPGEGRLSQNVEMRPMPFYDEHQGLDFERYLKGMRRVPTVREREAHRNPDRAVLDDISRFYLGSLPRE